MQTPLLTCTSLILHITHAGQQLYSRIKATCARTLAVGLRQGSRVMDDVSYSASANGAIDTLLNVSLHKVIRRLVRHFVIVEEGHIFQTIIVQSVYRLALCGRTCQTLRN